MSDDVPLFRISWGREEVANVVDSVTRGSYWANGPYVEAFEERIGEFLDADQAVAFNSGTTALVSALRALGIGEGDEVVVPSFTFVATANAVRVVGAEPVFADVERDRYGLDPESVAAVVTDDTAAILPVHYAGCPCRIEALADLADDEDLLLVEDAAEALGATVDGSPAGAVGDAGVLSFCQNKVAATGEGGAVVTDRDDVARELRLLRSHGRASEGYFGSADGGDYVTLGNNFRMPDVAAAIGVGQMDRLDDLLAGRRSVASRYAGRLAAVDGVEPMRDPPGGRHVYQLYTVTFDRGVDRDAVVDALADRGVASKVYFEPVHRTAYYRDTYDRPTDHLAVTDELSSRVLSLPIHPELADEDVDRVVAAVEDALPTRLTR